MGTFNSQNWFPDIKKLARFVFELSDKKFVSYNERVIDRILESYPIRLGSLKKCIYTDEDLATRRIDHHKMTALYIQLCLENEVFKLPQTITTRAGGGVSTKLINEMFCVRLAKDVLEAWNDKIFDTKKFKKEYMSSFLRLLWHYKDRAAWCKRHETFTYTLAHTIYFIERNFMM